MITDFHSHVLPNIDDGSSSLEISIEMLRMEAEQGIRYVVATPHFYAQHDSPRKFLERREVSKQQLLREMSKHNGLPQLVVGAEVYYFSGMSESESLMDLTIGNTKYILIEMPMSPWTDSMYEELYKIYKRRGLTPIVAHIDRYISPFKTYHIPERLEELPVLVQANASFFQRRFTNKMAMHMLREEKIHLIGSDCHNTSDRIPNLGVALSKIEKQLGMDVIKKVQLHEKEILHFT